MENNNPIELDLSSLNDDEKKLVNKLGLNQDQRYQVWRGFTTDGLTMEQVEKYAEPSYDALQMAEIREGLRQNLMVYIFMNPALTAEQMSQIRYGLEKHLPVAWYASTRFDAMQMFYLREALVSAMEKENSSITDEALRLLANPEFDWTQMDEILSGFENGLSLEEVKSYADPLNSWADMCEKREEILSSREAGR